ncbi:hypothetical protein [Cohnella thermotolerans]|uniref:hypothetical protein n=1 Tax=Cohnella thermotolerans TaxID=329858 RepID=UPI000412B29C|nr:hypothetical protein [Cohnella thermotolerans]
MMWKWIEWGAKLLASALLLSFLCVWTTGYIVNSYIQTVLKEMDIPLDVQPFALSGVWGTLWGADKPEAAEASPSPAPGNQAASGNQAPSEPPADAGAPEAGGASSAQPSPSPSPSPSADADTGAEGSATGGGDEGAAIDGEGGQAAGEQQDTPATKDSPEGQQEAGGDAVPVWNGEAAGAGSSALTDEERQRLYSIVVSKLSAEQLQQLSSYLEGGVTAEELPEVQKLLKNALSDKEYEQMLDIIQPPTPSPEP